MIMTENQISIMAENLIGSEIIRLSTEINQKIANGEKIYNLTIGDFDPQIFPIPEEFKKEIIASYNNNYTNYPAANGMKDLRDSISDHLMNYANLSYDPDNILVSCGSRPLIYATYKTILDQGEKVI